MTSHQHPRRFVSAWLVAALVGAAPAPAVAWGAVGHRITGAVAEQLLTPTTARAVAAILQPGETLADAANWADYIRSRPEWKRADPWHYVTALDGAPYSPDAAPPEGDAVTALASYRLVLRDPATGEVERREALRWVLHLVGDLHQPLHVGCRADRGGNDYKVTVWGADGRPTAANIHSVWDRALVIADPRPFGDVARELVGKVGPGDANPDPLAWVAESSALCRALYPADPNVTPEYVAAWHPVALDRLRRAGARIAAVLNEALGDR